MKYIIFLFILTSLFTSCDNGVDYPKTGFYAKSTQYDSIVKAMVGDTTTISYYVGCLHSPLDHFSINMDEDILDDGFFSESGCTENGIGYFDENLKFVNGLYNIVINYNFVVKEGDNSHSFSFYNKMGESVETENLIVRGVLYHEISNRKNMDLGFNYLYSLQHNRVYGDLMAQGKDITDENLSTVDFYYARSLNYWPYLLQSPHDPEDPDMMGLPKTSYYNEDGTSRCNRVTIYKKLENFNWENPTKIDFDNIEFIENNYKVDVFKGDYIAFKTQDNIIGVLKVLDEYSEFKFTIKYLK